MVCPQYSLFRQACLDAGSMFIAEGWETLPKAEPASHSDLCEQDKSGSWSFPTTLGRHCVGDI